MYLASPLCSDVFGDTAILGDRRWAGAYGVDADFVAGEHCSIARIRTKDIQVEISFLAVFLEIGTTQIPGKSGDSPVVIGIFHSKCHAE